MTKEEVAERWPEAVEFARQMRNVFGPEVRLIWAKNEAGEEIRSSAKSLTDNAQT